jgi:hypothetical protein
MKCEDCIHYDDLTTYKETGYCNLFGEFTKAEASCPDFEEED